VIGGFQVPVKSAELSAPGKAVAIKNGNDANIQNVGRALQISLRHIQTPLQIFLGSNSFMCWQL